MGVVSRWKQLTLNLARARAAVTQNAMQSLYSSLVALYETVFDDTAPGASSQIYQGHDHTPTFGGGPITRGLIWSEAGGDVALYEITFTAANQALTFTSSSANLERKRSIGGVAKGYPSPGLSTLGRLTGYLCYEASGSTFVLDFGQGLEVELPPTPAESPQWIEFATPLRPGQLQSFSPEIRCAEHDDENQPVVKIYSWTIEEERRAREGLDGVELREPVRAAAGSVPVGFMALEQALCDDEEWLDSDVLLRATSMLNGLHEGVEADTAPGATTQTVKGHDHNSGGYGGRAVARGVVVCAGRGNTTLFEATVAAANFNTWQKADGGGRSSLDMFKGYVSPGLTSSGNPPTSTPYLVAYVYLYESQSALSAVDLRIYNDETGTYSEVTSLGAGIVKQGWFKIDKVPCSGDSVNGFDLEIRSNGTGVTGDHDLNINAVLILEQAGVGAVAGSSGSAVLGGA